MLAFVCSRVPHKSQNVPKGATSIRALTRMAANIKTIPPTASGKHHVSTTSSTSPQHHICLSPANLITTSPSHKKRKQIFEERSAKDNPKEWQSESETPFRQQRRKKGSVIAEHSTTNKNRDINRTTRKHIIRCSYFKIHGTSESTHDVFFSFAHSMMRGGTRFAIPLFRWNPLFCVYLFSFVRCGCALCFHSTVGCKTVEGRRKDKHKTMGSIAKKGNSETRAPSHHRMCE